ncbi:MAG TPA: S41 family peptidase, partial [Chitinophaga sp.]|uniref:S41 family peptidase n=1 Tax=Chitinophaga sp. TaxID=1869181 RepID=UPI002F95F596
MKRIILTQLALVFALLLMIPAANAQTETCNCLDNLNKTIQETEANYAGYPAKVNAGYKQLVSRLQAKASAVTEPKKCYYLIREYVRSFKDKHFIISYTNTKDFDSVVTSYSQKPVLPIEGIWISPDSTTRIAIQRSTNGTFEAIKCESSIDSFPKGFVYFILTPKGDQYVVKKYDGFVSTDFPAKQTGNLLRIWNHTVWGKVSPQQMTAAENEELSTWKNNNNGLAFKKINAQVSYLKIPSFYNNDSKIQQLIAASDSTIKNTKYLIVDLRGNGGGNTGWVYFLPYLIT